LLVAVVEVVLVLVLVLVEVVLEVLEPLMDLVLQQALLTQLRLGMGVPGVLGVVLTMDLRSRRQYFLQFLLAAADLEAVLAFLAVLAVLAAAQEIVEANLVEVQVIADLILQSKDMTGVRMLLQQSILLAAAAVVVK
jgi:hypothetical protein